MNKHTDPAHNDMGTLAEDARALSTFGHETRNLINEADELDDAGTADLFTAISRGIDTWLWFVEDHSQVPR